MSKQKDELLKMIESADTSTTFSYDLDDIRVALLETINVIRALVEKEEN